MSLETNSVHQFQFMFCFDKLSPPPRTHSHSGRAYGGGGVRRGGGRGWLGMRGAEEALVWSGRVSVHGILPPRSLRNNNIKHIHTGKQQPSSN